MAFNNYLEEENDKPYFTKNSLAYYYDKMEGFAKAVEGSAKALNLTKEEIEQRIALRLAEWDKNLESFDSSVETLLTEWVDDGTLTPLIDSTLIDQRIAPVKAQLADKASQQELEVVKEQASNLIANAGDTDGNAELLDIRVGPDGFTYATSGEAVRAAADKQKLLSRAVKLGYAENANNVNLWEQGIVDANTGVNDNSGTYLTFRLRTKTFIPTSVRKVTTENDFVMNVMKYNLTDDSYIERSAASVKTFDLAEGFKYRIVLWKVGTGAITPPVIYMNANFFANRINVLTDVENIDVRIDTLEKFQVVNEISPIENLASRSSAFVDDEFNPFVSSTGLNFSTIEDSLSHTRRAFRFTPTTVGTAGLIMLNTNANGTIKLFARIKGKNIRVRLSVYNAGGYLGEENISPMTSSDNYVDLNVDVYPRLHTTGTYWRVMITCDEITISYINLHRTDAKVFGLSVAEFNMLKGSTLRNPIEYDGTEMTVFNKGIAIGDSMTEGVFNYTQDGVTAMRPYTKYSYPKYLQKLSGVEMTNLGSAGDTSVSWRDKFLNTDFSGHDFAIIQLGINDVLKMTGGFGQESIDAINSIIAKLKTQNSGIKIFIATIARAYSYNTTSYDAANTLLRQIAETTPDCFLIDLTRYSKIRPGGVYVNGHLTAYGYYQQAKEYLSYISYIMNTNRSAFKYVHFIGTTFTP